MSSYIYTCTDPRNKNIYLGNIEYSGKCDQQAIIETVRNEHPGCDDVILVNANGRPVNMAIDLDGQSGRLNMRIYDISKRRCVDNVSAIDRRTKKFLHTISAMLADGTAAVMDISEAAEKQEAPRGMIGYADEKNYYFLPTTVYAAVVQYDPDGFKSEIGMGQLKTFKRLRQQGIVRQTGSDGKTTRGKRTPDGKNQRLLWIPRQYIDETMEPLKAAEE